MIWKKIAKSRKVGSSPRSCITSSPSSHNSSHSSLYSQLCLHQILFQIVKSLGSSLTRAASTEYPLVPGRRFSVLGLLVGIRTLTTHQAHRLPRRPQRSLCRFLLWSLPQICQSQERWSDLNWGEFPRLCGTKISSQSWHPEK